MEILGKSQSLFPVGGLIPLSAGCHPHRKVGGCEAHACHWSVRRGSKCSVSWMKMSSSSLPYLMVRPFKGFDEMERARVSQPIKTFTCIICGPSTSPVFYHGVCMCVCVSENGV